MSCVSESPPDDEDADDLPPLFFVSLTFWPRADRAAGGPAAAAAIAAIVLADGPRCLAERTAAVGGAADEGGGDERADADWGRGVPGAAGVGAGADADGAEILVSTAVDAVNVALGMASEDDDA